MALRGCAEYMAPKLKHEIKNCEPIFMHVFFNYLLFLKAPYARL